MSTNTASRWSTRQVRKSRWIAAASLVFAAAALWACGQPWIAISLNGSPSCTQSSVSNITVINRGGQPVQVSVPSLCDNGWQLQAAAQNTAADKLLKDTYNTRQTTVSGFPSTFGVPTVVLWFAVAAALACLGAVFRNAIIIAGGLIPWSMASGAVVGTLKNIVGGLDPSMFAIQTGWEVLSYLQPLILGVIIVGTLYVAIVNHRVRKQAAEEAGRKPVIGVIRDLSILVSRAAEQSERTGIDSAQSFRK